MNGLYSGIAPEQRFIYILLSIIGITAGVQVLTIYTEMLILKFAMFKIQDNVSNVLFNEILNARLKFFYKQSSGALINHMTLNINKSYSCVHYLLRMARSEERRVGKE